MSNSRLLGVVRGTVEAPEVGYLDKALPVTEELLAMAAPLKPTEVFRFAAHCEERACQHFDGIHCRSATRIVQILPVVTEGLPACVVRPTCRWYEQEGKAAGLRCPQIVTQTYHPSEELQRAAVG